MGDKRRFALFADLVRTRFPDAELIADVAAGSGHLQAALRHKGFKQIVSWDKKKRHARGPARKLYKNSIFDYESAPRGYDLVLGMHPDQATDHIVGYAVKHRVPFVVCPCCVLPSAFSYSGSKEFDAWCAHLAAIAREAYFNVERFDLHMHGRARVLVGTPSIKAPLRIR
jgi:hypothetical protein